MKHSFERYASSKGRLSNRVKKRQAEADPYWLLLPQWLAERHCGRRKTDQKFLLDILRGQFCAFLALRIQDDVFDGQLEDRSMIFAADHLLLSAREAFSPWFADTSAFWPFFDASVRRTLNAIAGWDHCQTHGYGTPATARTLVRDGYAVCNLATFALCLRANRVGLFRNLVRCTDELAFVGHILDDLEDMQADFQRKRVNYAAWFLLGGSNEDRRNVIPRLTREMMMNESADRLFKMLKRRLGRAGEVADTLGIRELVDHVRGCATALESSEAALHRERVQRVFATVAR